MSETNSEKKQTWVSIAVSIATILVAAASALLESDLIPKEHTAYVIIAGIVAVATSAGLYTAGRSKKKAAEALAELAKPKPPENPTQG